MKAQQASLVTLVPSEQTALSAAGAARVTAARATRARREVKAISLSVKQGDLERKRLDVLRRKTGKRARGPEEFSRSMPTF